MNHIYFGLIIFPYKRYFKLAEVYLETFSEHTSSFFLIITYKDTSPPSTMDRSLLLLVKHTFHLVF